MFSQILAALGRKVAFAPSVDLEELAGATEGFSGADLQAVVYNAHLEVVHDAIAHPGDSSKPNGTSSTSTKPVEQPVKYTLLGGGGESQGRVLSRAEESAFQQRVRKFVAFAQTSPCASSRGCKRECDLLTSAWAAFSCSA